MRRFAGFAFAVVGISLLGGATPWEAVAHDGGDDWIGVDGLPVVDHELEEMTADAVAEMLANLEPATPTAADRSPALCGLLDTPETGIQGDVPLADQQSGRAAQGYNCGLAVVGYNNLAGQGGGDMAWSGQCAYVRSPGGIKVVDVGDPTAPAVVGFLPINVQSENIHAVTTSERAVLVAAQGNGPGLGQSVFVWDVRDCTHPALLGTAQFPGLSPGNTAVVSQVHNITLTEDGTHIWGSLPLQVADITNLADPGSWTVRPMQCEIALQTFPGFTGLSIFAQTAFAVEYPACANMIAHEFAFNAAGTRMYTGGQLPDWLAEARTPGIDWHTEQVLRVVDISVDPPQILGETEPAAGHGIRRATIGGKPFLLHSNENVNPDSSTVNGCFPDTDLPVFGAAHAFLTDISDETAPQVVSELELAINDPANCAAQLESRVRATIHWNEVDNAGNTTFAMLPQGNAGLRIFDVRDPQAPIERAYFNPGMFGSALDRAANHTHYAIRSTNCSPKGKGKCEAAYIWLTTRNGGFWVLELEPQVRIQLGLPLNPTTIKYPLGRPARPPGL